MKTTKYYIATNKGFLEVDGYECEVVYGEEKYKFGIRQESPKHWNVDCLKTGFNLVNGVPTKKEAVASITYDLMDKFESVLNNPNTLKRIKMLDNYKAGITKAIEHALV